VLLGGAGQPAPPLGGPIVTLQVTPRHVRLAAFAVGMLAAVAIAVAGRIPAGSSVPGLAVAVHANPTGELAVSSTAPVVQADALGATGRSLTTRGHLTITNQTDAPLAVRMRPATAPDPVDQLVRLVGVAGAGHIFAGPLSAQRGWSSGALRLAPHQQRTLVLTAGVDAQRRSQYASRAVDVTLEFRSTVLSRGKS
jgi:hypothetical protein